MECLLDTCVLSEIARHHPDVTVVAWMQRVAAVGVGLSVVTVGEVRFGIATMPEGYRREQLTRFYDHRFAALAAHILPVSAAVAATWGSIRAERQRRGRPLALADGLIAATALVGGLALATRNVDDFSDLGLRLINPWQA